MKSSKPGTMTKESLKDFVSRGSLQAYEKTSQGGTPITMQTRGPNVTGATSSLGESSNQSAFTGVSTQSDRSTLPRPPKPHQATLKQWISYERNIDATPAGSRNVRQSALKERSALSQMKPDDEGNGCFVGCLSSIGLRAKPVLMMPSPGEDVCGICHDNKPLLAMQFCEHKTCLLCAKAMCYSLDLNQLALCPFCGSLISSFGLA